MENTSRSFGLDCVRAVAIVLVLLAHFSKNHEFFGFWGVELFFALSGFLIGQILWRSFNQSKNWSISALLNFWYRRWWRTLPNYYLFIIISLIFHQLWYDRIPTLVNLSEFFWFGQNLMSRNREFYGVSWSLCIEEWFYLLFPTILFLLGKTGLNNRVAFLCTIIIICLGSVFIREYLLLYRQADSIRTITFARLDSIAFGVLIAFIGSEYKFNIHSSWVSFLIGLTFIFVPSLLNFIGFYSLESLRQSPIMLILVPLGSAMIIPLIIYLNPPTGYFSFISIGVLKLSQWSYSIYLSHIPVLFFCYYLLNEIRDSTVGNLFVKFVGLVLTLLFSGIIYHFFEVPLMKMRPSEYHPKNHLN